MARFASISIAVMIGLSACSTTPTQRDTLKQTYDRTAQYHLPDRNPIIVIPGILGSRLVDDQSGQTVWGVFTSDYADPATDDGAQLISLPIDGGMTEISHVRPDGVLESLEIDLLGIPIRVQAYAGILATLGAGGYRDETLGLNSIDYGTDHFTCFQFDYDWRRDISHNAAALKAFIDEKRVEVQENYRERYGIEDAEVTFDIAAHSMGGLLTRYFLRYGDQPLPDDALPELTWAGAEDVERVILVAPPNAGSLDAVEQLVEGFNTGRPLLPHYNPEILGTFPSVYQLLPRARHKSVSLSGSGAELDIMDPEVWQRFGWGLSGTDPEALEVLRRILPDARSDQERIRLAQDFQALALQRARNFQEAMDTSVEMPEGLELYLVTGDASRTPDHIWVDPDTGEIDIRSDGVGDGVVLRSSTLLDERIGAEWKPTLQTPIDWHGTLFLPSEHRTITSDPVFEDNVLYWLLESPRSD